MRLIKLKAIGWINGLHFTPDGRRLLAIGGSSAQRQDEARWVDIFEACETLRIPLPVNCYAVSPDLATLTVGNPRPVRQNTAQLPLLVTFEATDPNWMGDESRRRKVDATILEQEVGTWISCLTYDSVGVRLAIACSYSQNDAGAYYSTRYLQVVPLSTRHQPMLVTMDRHASHIAFSPDGSLIATVSGGDYTPRVAVWNAMNLELWHTFTAPAMWARQPVFSPDGKTLAVVNGGSVFFLTIPYAELHRTFAHPKLVNATAFTPDGQRLLSTCHDGLLRIWDTINGQLVTSYDWGIGQTTAVTVSPDGLTAAVGGQKGHVAVFDLD